MNRNDTPEVMTLNWKEEDGIIIIINTRNEQIMLNKTSGIIWAQINGINTVQEIMDAMILEYSLDNSITYLEKIVEEAIEEFVLNKLVHIRVTNNFDGWLQYE